jgi:hypothetical protein
LFWLGDEDDSDVMKVLQRLTHKQEPVFLYRCGDRTFTPPDRYYWRMMSEHPSMRVYQLEWKED